VSKDYFLEAGMVSVNRIYEHKTYGRCQVSSVAKSVENGSSLVIFQQLSGEYGYFAQEEKAFEIAVMTERDRKDASTLMRMQNLGSLNDVTPDTKSAKENKHETTDGESLAEEGFANKDLLEFLEAETAKEKKMILVGARPRMTDRLINDLAASLDITVDDGDIDFRYFSLLKCLDTMIRFEDSRLR